MKVAKVLACYFGNRRKYPKDKLESIALFIKQVELHESIDPGVEMDLIVVNHDIGDLEIREFLNQYENHKIFSGKIRILHRPRINPDFSIGSYKYAFYILNTEYDYWFFSEDDVTHITPNSLKNMIDIFVSDDNIGFISALNFKKYQMHLYQEEDGYIVGTGDNIPHAHGGMGLTSTEMMLRVTHGTSFFDTPNINAYKNGQNISPITISNPYENEGQQEMGFSFIFVQGGYKLKSFSDGGNFFHMRENMIL